MLKKSLNGTNVLIKYGHYPYRDHSSVGMKKVWLGIGGNVGDTLRHFEHLFFYFQRSSLVNILETAPILKNPPFGYTDQADFYNSVILIETNLTPKALLRYILKTEKRFGRKRLFKDAPRTLDIDIIFYENIVMNSKVLKLPHPGWSKRDSVLIPLSYMKGSK